MKIKDICEYGTKSKIYAGQGLPGGDYPFYTSSAVCNKYLDDAQFFEPGIIMGTGGNTTLHYCSGNFSVSTDCLVLFPKRNIETKYLYYFFKSNIHVLDAGFKGAGLKHTSKTYINEIEVKKIPQQIEQLKVVKILDSVQEIINKKEKQLEELDTLIKSRFVEMFGDPKDNPKRWDEVSVSDILGGKTSNGFFAKRDDYCDDGNVCILGVADIVNRMYSEIKDLPRTSAVYKDIEKYEVKYGDILFCRSSLVAAGIGKASIVPLNTPKNILFECHVIRLQLDLTKCIPEYIQMLTTTDYFRNQVLRHAKTSTMTTVGQDGIVNNLVILPPLIEQQKFYEFIRHVDKLKFEVKQSLNETKQLFDSLMQEYFG